MYQIKLAYQILGIALPVTNQILGIALPVTNQILGIALPVTNQILIGVLLGIALPVYTTNIRCAERHPIVDLPQLAYICK